MIVKEFFKTRDDGVNLYRTYSDSNKKIRKVGTDEVYDDAIDVENSGFEYEETEIVSEDFTDAEFRAMVEGVM